MIYSIREASHILGVSPRRVRRLSQSGLIGAQKVGNAWVLDERVLSMAPPRVPGRRPSSRNAWALLALLAGEGPDWIDRAVRSRLRKLGHEPGRAARLLAASLPRSEIRHLAFLPADLKRIEGMPLIASGLYARLPALGLVYEEEMVDAYVSAEAFACIVEQYRPLDEPRSPNAVLRIPSHPWVLRSGAQAPGVVIAADLLSASDPRVAEAARRLIDDLARDLNS